jgi:hypothetical protein
MNIRHIVFSFILLILIMCFSFYDILFSSIKVHGDSREFKAAGEEVTASASTFLMLAYSAVTESETPDYLRGRLDACIMTANKYDAVNLEKYFKESKTHFESKDLEWLNLQRVSDKLTEAVTLDIKLMGDHYLKHK